eukprot:5645870-Prymnesium_polylepis.1
MEQAATHHDQRAASFTDDVNATLAQIGAPVRLDALSGRGLGMIATRSLPAGTVLLHERPFVLNVGYEHRKHVCALCLADSRHGANDMQSAKGWRILCECGAVSFCSDECQRTAEDGGLHSAAECAAYKQLVASFGSHDDTADLVMQAVRILSHRAEHRTVRALDDAPLEVSYESYAKRLCGFARTRRTGDVLRRSAQRAVDALPPALHVPLAELCDTLNHHQANVYGVLGHGAQEVALSSFVGLFQLFNHSCLPNMVFDCRPRQPDPNAAAPFPPRFAL